MASTTYEFASSAMVSEDGLLSFVKGLAAAQIH
jgi:hypothetical protein